MATDNGPYLRRLRSMWSDNEQATDPKISDVTAHQLRAMTFGGVRRFTQWWLTHLVPLPVNATSFGGTIRTIVRIWPATQHDTLRKCMQAARLRLTTTLTGVLSVEERVRLMGLERSLIHMLLADWDQ